MQMHVCVCPRVKVYVREGKMKATISNGENRAYQEHVNCYNRSVQPFLLQQHTVIASVYPYGDRTEPTHTYLCVCLHACVHGCIVLFHTSGIQSSSIVLSPKGSLPTFRMILRPTNTSLISRTRCHVLLLFMSRDPGYADCVLHISIKFSHRRTDDQAKSLAIRTGMKKKRMNNAAESLCSSFRKPTMTILSAQLYFILFIVSCVLSVVFTVLHYHFWAPFQQELIDRKKVAWFRDKVGQQYVLRRWATATVSNAAARLMGRTTRPSAAAATTTIAAAAATSPTTAAVSPSTAPAQTSTVPSNGTTLPKCYLDNPLFLHGPMVSSVASIWLLFWGANLDNDPMQWSGLGILFAAVFFNGNVFPRRGNNTDASDNIRHHHNNHNNHNNNNNGRVFAQSPTSLTLPTSMPLPSTMSAEEQRLRRRCRRLWGVASSCLLVAFISLAGYSLSAMPVAKYSYNGPMRIVGFSYQIEKRTDSSVCGAQRRMKGLVQYAWGSDWGCPHELPEQVFCETYVPSNRCKINHVCEADEDSAACDDDLIDDVTCMDEDEAVIRVLSCMQKVYTDAQSAIEAGGQYDPYTAPSDDGWPTKDMYGDCGVCEAYTEAYVEQNLLRSDALYSFSTCVGLAALSGFLVLFLQTNYHRRQRRRQRQRGAVGTANEILMQ